MFTSVHIGLHPCHHTARTLGYSPASFSFVPCRIMPVRWSRYNPSYLEPEVKKEWYQKPLEELTEEEREQMELKAVQPIKAAPPTLSSSVFSDPMIRSEKAAAPLLSRNGWELCCPPRPSPAGCTLPFVTAQSLYSGLIFSHQPVHCPTVIRDNYSRSGSTHT